MQKALVIGTVFLVVFVAALPAAAGIPQSERNALMALYTATNGGSWTHNDGWGSTTVDECHWYGISCNTAGNSVTGIDLHSNNLSGQIPSDLQALTNLQVLMLSDNAGLTGSIPQELGSLSSLFILDLDSDQLSGPIPPELGNLWNLQMLFLGSNQLSGSIPSELGNLFLLLDNGGLELRWNALHTEDSSLIFFLNQKQNGGDWQSTQTMWPMNLSGWDVTGCSITLGWDSVDYTDPGGYRIEVATSAGGPWAEAGVFVPSKDTTSVTVTGLDPNTTYWFRVRSYTLPHANNRNTVLSDPSPLVSAMTGGAGGELDGDVDGDNSVETGDLDALLGYLFGPSPAQRPDVNCDGRIDAADVMNLLDLL